MNSKGRDSSIDLYACVAAEIRPTLRRCDEANYANMYKHFFGLRENPFNVNPDPRYLFLTPQTREALDELTYGIHARKGLFLLTGEVGTGKTTLINRLLDRLHQEQTPTAFIFNSHLEVSHLFDFILAGFGLPLDAGSQDNALMHLNQWLIDRYRAGETPVLIVDEAQGLPMHVLEEIRMLLNLETPHEKLLQIVLAGQPELKQRLKRHDLRQIDQRIAFRCQTAALTLGETHDYIYARLHIAGANGKQVFAPEAMDAVHFYSRGIPRVMNLLCEHALIKACLENVRPVPLHFIEAIARENQFDDIKPVAPSMDSGGTLSANLIAMQSTVVSGPIHPLPASEQKRVEGLQPSVPTMVDSDAHIQLIDELAIGRAPLALAPLLHVVKAKAECDPLPAPSPCQVCSRQESVHPLTAVNATESTPLATIRMTLLALGLSLTRWSAIWRDRLLAGVTSPAWTQMAITLLRGTRWPADPAREWYRRCLAWRNKCLRVLGSIDWPGMKASLYRWLQQPWNPIQWRLPESRLFEAWRRFSYRKI
jgi:type II secretory pathway predicted ATPase ExeA